MAAYTEIHNKNKEISGAELEVLMTGCIIWAVLANYNVRERLRISYYGNIPQGWAATATTGVFEFLRGTISGRDILAGVETGLDTVAGTQLAGSSTGVITRYLGGAAYGACTSYAAIRHSPGGRICSM